MKLFWKLSGRKSVGLLVVAALLLLAAPLIAQPKPPTLAPASTNQPQDLEQWMRDNLDDSVVNLIDQFDPARVHDFLNKLQARFDGTNIYELASMKDIAVRILPVLNQFEETQPYAAWLQAHLDDLDVANKIQRSAGTNGVARVTRPSMKIQREIWVKEIGKRPWPPLAQTYVPKLKEVFLSENTPPALVWVAEVESGFNPKAKSPAGAAGMFQLMPSTARSEDLSLWPFDQRYQPEPSARAAARYLHSLHQHYRDWPLALAAYNVGQGRLDKLLKTHKVDSFDEVSRWLPAETQMYVPKIEATVRLREGLELASL